jgi:hypothetical protein
MKLSNCGVYFYDRNPTFNNVEMNAASFENDFQSSENYTILNLTILDQIVRCSTMNHKWRIETGSTSTFICDDARIANTFVVLGSNSKSIEVELLRDDHRPYSLNLVLYSIASEDFEIKLKGNWKSNSFSDGQSLNVYKNTNLKISTPWNLPSNCLWWNVSSSSAPTKSHTTLIIILSTVCGVLLLITVVVAIVCRRSYRLTLLQRAQQMIYSEDSNIETFVSEYAPILE